MLRVRSLRYRHGVHSQQIQHGIALFAALDISQEAFLKFRERSFCAAGRLAAVQVHERDYQSETDGGSESGWAICGHCGIPLKQSDGGPVALPDGGPLGPDACQKDS